MILLLGALIACGPQGGRGPSEGEGGVVVAEPLPPVSPPVAAVAGAKPATPPDILLVTVDGLRADHLSPWGYPRETAPWLAALAREGVLFERAYATSPWEAPALASLHTGTYVPAHGVDRGVVRGASVSGQPTLAAAHETLAERLQAAGYQTRAVSSTAHASPATGFGQGFDRFDALGFQDDAAAARAALADAPPDERPRFVWVHLRDPRGPYAERAPWFEGWAAEPIPPTVITRAAPDREREARQQVYARQIAAYDSEIRATDEQLAGLVATLGLGPEDVIVVMGAEGEELGDHGRLGRRSSLFEEQVRVPLVVRAPGARAGARVQSPVSAVDLLPTLVALATGQAPAGAAGLSLLPALAGEALPARVLPLELRATDTRFLRGLIWDRWKLIRVEGTAGVGEARLYDLVSDPGELQDRAALEPQVLQRMGEALDAWRAGVVLVRPEPPADGG